MAFGSTWDVIGAFVVTFTVPYLLGSPGANLGPKVAWIFAGTSGLSFIYVTLFVPELKGRSLEEVDELFVSDTRQTCLTRYAGHGSLGVAVCLCKDVGDRTSNCGAGDRYSGHCTGSERCWPW